MCGDFLRDGSDTRTIPVSNSQCESNKCDTDYRFGMHENNAYYSDCSRRVRNKGLFTANQVTEIFFFKSMTNLLSCII